MAIIAESNASVVSVECWYCWGCLSIRLVTCQVKNEMLNAYQLKDGGASFQLQYRNPKHWL